MNKLRSTVPWLFRGPTPSRFYFISGDHWLVTADVDKTVLLRRKEYSSWQIAIARYLIPTTIATCGVVLYRFTGVPLALVGTLGSALAAGIPIYYINRIEHLQLEREPVELLAMRSDGTFEIRGEVYGDATSSDLFLEYTYYYTVWDSGSSNYSELDVVVIDGSQKRRINLLAQASDWALKHAIKLQRFSGLELKRKQVFGEI